MSNNAFFLIICLITLRFNAFGITVEHFNEIKFKSLNNGLSENEIYVLKGNDSTDLLLSLNSINKRSIFIPRKQIKMLNVSEIIDYNYNAGNCNRSSMWGDSARCFLMYKFENGKLTKEISFDEYMKDTHQADSCAYVYTWRNNRLIYRTGNSSGTCSASQKEFVEYKYDKHGKMTKDIFEYRMVADKGEGAEINVLSRTITSYFYNIHGQIDHLKQVDSKGGTYYTYYLYSDNSLVGNFSYSYRKSEGLDPSKKVFSQKKLQELKNIGFESFKKKYFTQDIYKKIVDNCYTPIKNEELLINGKPIKTFLSEMGKNDSEYVVLEIADNYFLFYKLID